MSYNGSGTFQINTSGQPVVTGTVISSSAFNALTADLATGLSTAITKDGQTATTVRIPFAAGINSSLATDSSSISTGSIITAGGVGIAKNAYIGGNVDVAGTLNVTGAQTLTNPVINNIKMGYTTTVTAAGTTTLTVASNYRQFFTGSTTQTIVLPVTSTLVTGIAYEIENNSTGLLTVNSSGGNLVGTIPAGVCAHAVCIGTTLTTAADWDWDYISTSTITGTGANVLATSPTITTPTISSLTSAAATALTLQSAGTTAVTVDTSQNVGIGTTSPANKLDVSGAASATPVTNGIVRILTTGSNPPTGYGGGLLFTQVNSGGTNQDYASITGSRVNSSADNKVDLVFSTGDPTGSIAIAERMRIDTSGHVLINATSTGSFSAGAKLSALGVTGEFTAVFRAPDTGNYIVLSCDNPNGQVGKIQTSGSATSFLTSSDYRLKEDIAPMTGALAKVAALKPVTYKWKIDGTDGQGFIAHELAEVVPDCVGGEKDAVDANGNPQYQGVDTSFLVATLTAAIQEQQALIISLTARIAALEAK